MPVNVEYPSMIALKEKQAVEGVFPHLLGQEKAKMLLERSIASGRIPHAFLFRGPDGVGKQLFARSVAAILNCRGNTGSAACGKCSSCRKFHSGNHPDFVVINPEQGTIKINRIRELTRALAYPPYESSIRVVLLEDIHTMRREAANSLLKTLEEPPENNLLILTAESSKSVLSTITSRCQIIPFFPLSLEDTVRIILEQEKKTAQETAVLLARLSEGSPGRALLFKKMEMVETWEKVITVVRDSENAADGGISQTLRMAEELAALKENLVPFLGLLRIWIRDGLISSLHQKDGGAVTSPHPKHTGRTAHFFAKLEAVNRAERELARNCNRTLVCEVLLFCLQKH